MKMLEAYTAEMISRFQTLPDEGRLQTYGRHPQHDCHLDEAQSPRQGRQEQAHGPINQIAILVDDLDKMGGAIRPQASAFRSHNLSQTGLPRFRPEGAGYAIRRTAGGRNAIRRLQRPAGEGHDAVSTNWRRPRRTLNSRPSRVFRVRAVTPSTNTHSPLTRSGVRSMAI